MNWKAKGEKGQRIAIGELAKWDIDVAIPLSDNLSWDFILVYNGKLYRTQVKSGERKGNHASINFGLTTNNWYAKTEKKYTAEDCDCMILCDYKDIYLLGPKNFSNRSSFTIRREEAKNKQTKRTNMHDDFVVSKKRLQDVFG